MGGSGSPQSTVNTNYVLLQQMPAELCLQCPHTNNATKVVMISGEVVLILAEKNEISNNQHCRAAVCCSFSKPDYAVPRSSGALIVCPNRGTFNLSYGKAYRFLIQPSNTRPRFCLEESSHCWFYFYRMHGNILSSLLFIICYHFVISVSPT